MWGETVVQSLTRFKTTTIHDWKQCRENPNILLHKQQSQSRGITETEGKEKQSWHSWVSHANRVIDKERVTKSSCGIGPWPGRMNRVIPVQSASGRCELDQEVKLRSASSSYALVEKKHLPSSWFHAMPEVQNFSLFSLLTLLNKWPVLILFHTTDIAMIVVVVVSDFYCPTLGNSHGHGWSDLSLLR